MKKFVTKIKTKVKETAKDVLEDMRENPVDTLLLGVSVGIWFACGAVLIGVKSADKKSISLFEAREQAYMDGVEAGKVIASNSYDNYLVGTGKSIDDVAEIKENLTMMEVYGLRK